MITFITNDRERHQFKGRIINEEEGKEEVEAFIEHSLEVKQWVAKDWEATGLDAYKLKPLLLGLGNKEVQYCIDVITVDISGWKILDEARYLGHNLKYDTKLEIVHYPFRHRNIYDTQIAEQKIYQGCQVNPWFKFNLAAVTTRHLKKTRIFGKDIRDEFIGADVKTFQFKQKHIEYLAEDLSDLHDIMDNQVKSIVEYNLGTWLKKYEFPLVYHLAQCELNGFEFDKVNWQKNVDESIIERHKFAVELDKEIQVLKGLSKNPNRLRLSGGKFTKPRNLQEGKQIQLGLFGEIESKFDFYNTKKGKPSNIKLDKKKKSVKIEYNPKNINYGSGDVILFILGCLGFPAPLQGEAGRKHGYLIPALSDKTQRHNKNAGYDSEGNLHYFSTGKKEGYTTGKNYFTKYLVDMPETRLRKFIMLLMQWREADHEINSFGENFFDKINPVTGRLHTEFRQAMAVNARFQSGDSNNQPDKYNCQNIPRKSKFRHCFYGAKIINREGNIEQPSVVTSDLSGAEVGILCDQSQDDVLYEWAIVQDDTHSPMVQNVWRNIFLYRAGIEAKNWFNPVGYTKLYNNKAVIDSIANNPNEAVIALYEKATNFIVSKKVNAPYRQAGKNGTFGGLYGMKPAKAAETFNGTDSELMKVNPNYTPVNVTKEEGQVILFAQKTAIPKAYAYVESNVEKAFRQGYLQYDFRSNSRIWFPAVLKVFKEASEEHEQNFGISDPDILYMGKGKYRVPQTGLEYFISDLEAKDVEGQARNVPISGTQADCIKEAIVDICNYIEANNLKDYKWLKQVHDELVFSMPKDTDGKSDMWLKYKVTHNFVFDKPVDDDDFKYPIEQKHYTQDNKLESVDVCFPVYVKLAMIEAANRHMKKVKMGAEYTVLDSWTK